ncbi:hypothetical protein [Nocardia paucivorans]|uniref:hypothetical protein n=1 Tax=Nocardia paucivorans TaxID=114259 RepID=UPI0002F072DB|nr:hypothetical protein [Nocardia paucivorans]
MEPEDFSGKTPARAIDEVVKAAVRLTDGAAQAAARPLREMGDTLDPGIVRTIDTSRDASAALDTPTMNLRRTSTDSDDEGVEYWEPDTQHWIEPETRRFDTIEMQDGYIGEDIPGQVSESGVRYLRTEAERQPFRLEARDGLLHDANGNLFDTRDARYFNLLGSRLRRAIFVMDADGNLYASLFAKRHVFQHSSFLAGGPVAGAGEIEVVDGRITLLTDNSGHYMPKRDHTMQVLARLRELGVDIDMDRVALTASD